MPVTFSLPLEPNTSFTNLLPSDKELQNHPREVLDAAFSYVNPQAFPKASLLAFTEKLANDLALHPEQIDEQTFVELMSGQLLFTNQRPYAQCYGGHQFGHWAGQLGDGRAINIGAFYTKSINSTSQGKAADQSKKRQLNTQVLQLKGAGKTPYSRSADGLAVLRSSVREFLCSEAMFHLGVPTTRALSLCLTGENVWRDMFYDGRPALEQGAIVCRVAPSFLRFGSFELFAVRQEIKVLEQLSDYLLNQYFTDLSPTNKDPKDHLLAWFHWLCEATASLIVHWQRIGFVHGVMNTDNMSVLGLTIDYGPYGWLESYDAGWTPNTTDAQGKRYRFGAQPQVALWNLIQLGNSIFPLIQSADPLEECLQHYQNSFEKNWLAMQRKKLGFFQTEDDDVNLINRLYKVLTTVEADYILFFRALVEIDTNTQLTELPSKLLDTLYNKKHTNELLDWCQRYQQRLRVECRTNPQCLSPKEKNDLKKHSKRRHTLMNTTNPLYVLRNWLAQEAIDEITEYGTTKKLQLLQKVLQNPYSEQSGCEHLASMRPEWALNKPGCSMLSCSS